MPDEQRRNVTRADKWSLLAVSFLALALACYVVPSQPTVEFSFENRTETLLCEYPSTEDAAGGRCLAEVPPGAVTKWEQGCGYGDRPQQAPITVVLTVRESAERIYARTATCEAWLATDREFVIEQDGDEFLVVDSLSGP